MRYFILLFLWLTLTAQSPAEEPVQIGVAEQAYGATKVTTNDKTKLLRKNDAVFLNDIVRTAERAGAEIKLLDESLFHIGPESELTLDEFVYEPERANNKIHAHLAKGALRFVTGRIALTQPNDMKVDFPSGTMGIRGTTVGAEVIGSRASVVLLQSDSRFVDPDHVGHIVLSAMVDGELKETHIRDIGFGSVIEGVGQAPSAAFPVGDDVIDRLMARFEKGRQESARQEAVRDSKTSAENFFGKKYVSVREKVTDEMSYRDRVRMEETKSTAAKPAVQEDEDTLVVTVDGEESEPGAKTHTSLEF
ncbi:MAG: FecR domain-containing protein [Candidatus Omnitrophota bacterium]|nr:FecR domain-containing protein [Candidatus Omnitrophota bacterium]